MDLDFAADESQDLGLAKLYTYQNYTLWVGTVYSQVIPLYHSNLPIHSGMIVGDMHRHCSMKLIASTQQQ